MSFKIIGSGSEIPSKKISNAYISKKTKKRETWIYDKTGISTRYFVDKNKGESSSSLAYNSSLKAIKNAKINKEKIDFIISCNFTGDYIFPCLASKLAKMLKINCGVFDLSANCSGFQLGLSVAEGLLTSRKENRIILIVGTAVQSAFLNWNSVENSMYFGDGSGALIIKKVRNSKSGILGHETFTEPSAYEDVKLVGGGSNQPANLYNAKNRDSYLYDMSGIETWKQVVTNQPANILSVLKKTKKKLSQIDYFIFHQANKNLILFLAKKMNIPKKKIIFTVENYGNTADASVPITFDKLIKSRKLKKNDLILMSSVGAGFIYCSTIIRWT